MARPVAGITARGPLVPRHRSSPSQPAVPVDRLPVTRALQVAAVLGVTVFAAGYAAATVPALVADESVVYCYRESGLTSGRNPVLKLPLRRSDYGSTTVVEGPVSRCARAWQDGQLTGRLAGQARPARWEKVPPLVACTLPDRRLAVFPGDAQTCARLRVAAFPP
jgi:hypothetical protein